MRRLEAIPSHTPGYDLLHSFVTSFCTDGDLLSQWSGYAFARGFAVGLDSGVLASKAIAEGAALAEVTYDRTRQVEQLANVATSILRDNPTFTAHQLSTTSDAVMMLIALSFKDVAFHEENEWRLGTVKALKTDRPSEWSSVKFRSSPLVGVVPYLRGGHWLRH